MNRKVYVLQAKLLFSPYEEADYFIFSSRKKAFEFYDNMCRGCSIGYWARCTYNHKFKDGLRVPENSIINL